MTRPNSTPQVRRVVLVPASGRGDELVRRYRLARMRVEGRRAAPAQGARSGTLDVGCRT